VSRIKKFNNNKSKPLDYTLNVEENNEYGTSDLNWQDDGGVKNDHGLIDPSIPSLTDPSINDYNKGYEMEPYTMRYFADRNVLHQTTKGETLASIAKKYFGHENQASKIAELNSDLAKQPIKEGLMLIVGRRPERVATKEVQDITYTPENLAKEILTLWSQVDGPIQNFYDGFTMNKTTNEMKKQIAEILKGWGYEVTPTLTDETPRYASKIKVFTKISKLSKGSIISRLAELNKIFPTSKVAKAMFDEVTELEKSNIIVKKAEAMGMLDYFKQIFPDDYASALIDVTLDKPTIGFEEFKDIQLSDEALDQMEKMDSGNQDPVGKPNDGGMGGYDSTTQMRSDSPSSGGVSPSSYETGPFNVYKANAVTNRLKKK
jgi:hypothetical protein